MGVHLILFAPLSARGGGGQLPPPAPSPMVRHVVVAVRQTMNCAYTAENVILLVTSCSVRNVREGHLSQYLKFQGILEFVGRQLVASSIIFSEPSTQRKATCLLQLLTYSRVIV